MFLFQFLFLFLFSISKARTWGAVNVYFIFSLALFFTATSELVLMGFYWRSAFWGLTLESQLLRRRVSLRFA